MNAYLKIKIVGYLFLILLVGCKPMDVTPERHETSNTAAEGDQVYSKNSNPTQAYRITMIIEDAPGTFERVSGTAYYQMTNHKQCTPIEPIAGVWNKPDEDGIPIHFEKRDASTYVGTIYADGMVDADYYKKGVCKFELDGIGISLRATGKKQETRFQPALFKSQIHDARPVKFYFWKGGYPRSEMDNYPDTGEYSADKYSEPNRSNLFQITLKSEKVSK
ncbi:hypothetical protein MUG10_14750 [Xanthomonas prunicola]|uniref:Lipoprotein n=1 Tax=Xanthomonas prunicola TaxID=2053930 RepID=A0A9Q9J0N1_9XANT|nr:hypothetical protein [Xanthomonas prunicola]USI99330.1 hypothetical protein MUG10_14750 [Xanthomonas prunicola]UXA47753.1 hypothetical protein M0D44_15600 [Xanthomonas prunicola]UXA56216.1 hypothetical protein M0D47_15540 [Xanthomonas prunicola]UXA62189.1 hypothetical protein M0D48_04045 [Xanthomonas prunicola]UXA64388.1 hypothetical protein M0D43_15710 [Xanthomonas prunicola]